MADDLLLQGRNGCKVTEDVPDLKIYVELGPDAVVASVATANLTSDDHGKLQTNEGAAGDPAARPFNLPAAVAGLKIPFYDQNGSGLRIVAAGGDTIRVGSVVSVAAGYCQITQLGAMIVLRAINGTEWVAEPTTDPWVIQDS